MSIEPVAQMVRDERSVPTIQEVTSSSSSSSSKQGPSVTPKRPPQSLKYWIQGRSKTGELSDMTELDIGTLLLFRCICYLILKYTVVYILMYVCIVPVVMLV
jgi:hypothetical protein